MKKLIFSIILCGIALFSSGCIQEHVVVPVATITGQIIVPAGKVPTGVAVSIVGSGDSVISTYANENGEFELEVDRTGRYLIFARGNQFDINYKWVDAKVGESADMGPISLDEKIVGEGFWLASILDYQPEKIIDNNAIFLKPSDPSWADDSYAMYDDGTHGDKLANDGIYSLRMANLTTGSQLYTFDVKLKDGKTENFLDKHQEAERQGKSELSIPSSNIKLAKGTVTSDLTGVNYSEVKLSTKKGARTMNLNSDGTYKMAMEGNGKEYLVFRSQSFDIKAVPVDLTSVPVYEVPEVKLAAKQSRRLKLILIKNDFADVDRPVVVGDFTSWQPEQMYDNGTNGDDIAGDGVYTRVFTNVAPGFHKYAFNITQENQVKDPYQESGDSKYSIILVK